MGYQTVVTNSEPTNKLENKLYFNLILVSFWTLFCVDRYKIFYNKDDIKKEIKSNITIYK